MRFSVGTGGYWISVGGSLILAGIAFGGLFLLVAYDHFVRQNFIPRRLPVIAAISVSGILIFGVLPAWQAYQHLADFDTLILPGDGRVVLQHSFRHHTVTLQARDIRGVRLVEYEDRSQDPDVVFMVDYLVVETKDGRVYRSEAVDTDNRAAVERLKAMLPAIETYLARYAH